MRVLTHEVGPPSDVFSLGAVLAFAATGEGPFGSGSSAALIYRLVHNPPDLRRAPAETRSLIERCLDKDPGRRPSPHQLLAELGEASLAPGWLPEAIVQDTGQPGPATPVPSPAMSVPPAFGFPSASFPAVPALGAPAGGPGNPLTVTHARLSQPAPPPPWPGSVPVVTPSDGRRGQGDGGRWS
jgi:serine/threonine protein kinase